MCANLCVKTKGNVFNGSLAHDLRGKRANQIVPGILPIWQVQSLVFTVDKSALHTQVCSSFYMCKALISQRLGVNIRDGQPLLEIHTLIFLNKICRLKDKPHGVQGQLEQKTQ